MEKLTIKKTVPDIEREISDRAEELAESQYKSGFASLTKDLQFKVWSQAEQEVREKYQLRAESLWDELELQRMLGK